MDYLTRSVLIVFLSCHLFLIEAKSVSIPDLDISDDDIKKIVNDMRRIDMDKALEDQIKLNFQSHTSERNSIDQAPRRLFTYVDKKLMDKEAIITFRKLLDNYKRHDGMVEKTEPAEKLEQKQFMDFIMSSDIIKKLYNFLKIQRHGYALTPEIFRTKIQSLWFTPYVRDRSMDVADTSGFEHVFVGEVHDSNVEGLHNWIRFFYLERRGELNYKGWLTKRGKLMVGAKYGWKSEWKRSGSFMIGTSPEFDLAVYTLCFLARRGHNSSCNIEIDGCEVKIRSEEIRYNGKVYVGDVYPLPGKIGPKCRETTHQTVSKVNLNKL